MDFYSIFVRKFCCLMSAIFIKKRFILKKHCTIVPWRDSILKSFKSFNLQLAQATFSSAKLNLQTALAPENQKQKKFSPPKKKESIYKLTKVCPTPVIPQVRTITRYGTGSVILFNCAESPTDIVYTGDSVQTGSHDTFLCRFALSYGMTQRIGTEVLCVNMYIVTKKNSLSQATFSIFFRYTCV